MNEYRYQQRQRKREDRCLIDGTAMRKVEHGTGTHNLHSDGSFRRTRSGDYIRVHNPASATLCGCGNCNPPAKHHKKRIVRARLKKQLRKEVNSGKQ